MFAYFQNYYVDTNFGPGYVATHIAYIAAAVLLLNDTSKTVRGILEKLCEMALCWFGTIVFCSIYFELFGAGFMDRIMMAVFLTAYAVFRSKYKAVTRVVRSCVFFSCTMLVLPISEPIGKLIEEINPDYTWAEHLTSVIVVIMTLLVLLYLRKFSTENLSFMLMFPAVLLITISALGVLQLWLFEVLNAERKFTIIMAGSCWLLELMGYYMFYIVSREYDWNLELLAIQHKMELDQDMLKFSRESYEEMHMIRHEVKNHLAYIKVLVDSGEYGRLNEYLNTVSGETEELFRFIECGNDVVNAVMNRAIKQAHFCGVEIESQIVVPPQLPYRETELCSLLSNLVDNAIEGAAQSGTADPVVSVSILPQQDYLFIRVENPVNDSIPARKRLSLRTTKENQQAHGYGTKIIRSIAERNQGSVKFDIQDGKFLAAVMLYLAEEDKFGENISCNL